jgi:spore coat protein F
MMEESIDRQHQHLAYHETMEIHELVAFQSNGLMKLKKSIADVQDERLRALYQRTIGDLGNNLRELLQFYSLAPRDDIDDQRELGTGFYAGDLLGLAKSSVRNYAAAITETATPQVREVLTSHLLKAIKCHADVFNYMYKNGMYPAYDLRRLLENDMKNATRAINMNY